MLEYKYLLVTLIVMELITFTNIFILIYLVLG